MIWAIIQFQFDGFHKWIDAPEEIKFLRNIHRHVFHCKIYIKENVNIDRDIEFISLKNELKGNIHIFHNDKKNSCEDIGKNINRWLKHKYPERKTKVYVYEDNENGCCIE